MIRSNSQCHHTVNLICALIATHLALLAAATVRADIRYVNPADFRVRGSWTEMSDGTTLFETRPFPFDMNLDGLPDLTLFHGYDVKPERISRIAADTVRTANRGILDIGNVLHEIRGLAVNAANSGVNDEDSLALDQARVDNMLDDISRISHRTSFSGRNLLDGSAGVRGIPSRDAIDFLTATERTMIGTYSVNVIAPAESARVVAPTTQSVDLAQDEILTINGVTFELTAGQDRYEVVDRINDFTILSGVRAGLDANAALSIESTIFGTESEVVVISNRAAASDSSGFANTTTSDTGQDIVVAVDGAAHEGHGRNVTLFSGPAQGLSFLVKTHPVESWRTFSGDQGSISVVDDSLKFPLGPNEADAVSLSIPRMHPSGLGISVPNNQFGNLSEIAITNAWKAQDALGVIDAAIDEVTLERNKIELFLADHYLPDGAGTAQSIGLSGIVERDHIAALLQSGESIGRESPFSEDELTIQGIPGDAGFLGIKLFVEDDTHFGWIRVGVDEDNSLVVRDFAYQTQPGVGILAGQIPEPTELTWLVLGIVSAIGCCRKKSHVSRS